MGPMMIPYLSVYPSMPQSPEAGSICSIFDGAWNGHQCQGPSGHGRCIVTRSHKANDRDHKGIAEGTISPTETVPRFFGKNGFADVDPKKVKKDGSGRGNWGTVNDDIAGEQFTFTNTRRRSNSSSFSHITDFKTKFEVNEPEPVFEEALHGPEEEDHEDLTKTDSSESGRSSS
ncbi:uncharacterized protein B0J16DRAFT_381045 [Fusarium flagelliforme]|uniref:uncharacterized protein n=1 Tax=Fusarium flagelliforme TaxID=2675880 RepID=UPI001E8CBDB4|nr:uncharacterized protein B0J16DRAFT_381045 [Fusarium flagelliforme]KAH7193158.1 hypothetical protein B0J16DRAFT_381045 [Fusarium flagelliforme]